MADKSHMKNTSSRVSNKMSGGSQSAGGRSSAGKKMTTTIHKPGASPSYMKG